MGHGASKAEKLNGTAVTGKWFKRVEMPPGVIAEQMPRGTYPGKKFLGFTPLLLQELNASKGTTSLYLEFEQVIADECGGNNFSGWDSKKINDVVTRYQPRFNEKGVSVTYSMVRWYVHHGSGGHMEHRYWLSFADLETIPTGVLVSEDAYDPSKDIEEQQSNKSEVPVVVGSVVAGEVAAFDPCGTWVADMATATGDAKKWVTQMEFTATKNGSVYAAAGSYRLGMMCFSYKGSFQCTMQRVPGTPNEFLLLSSEGDTYTAVPDSADAFTSTQSGGGDSVVWRRSTPGSAACKAAVEIAGN